MRDVAVWGAPEWAFTATVLFILGAIALLWSYSRAPSRRAIRIACGLLKLTGLAALAMCLVEPLLSGLRPRPGANLFVVAVDDSQSMHIHDPGIGGSRGMELQRSLLSESPWQTRLGQDFDVRRFVFDTQLRAVKDFAELTFEGEGSAFSTTLASLSRRFRGLPVGGVLLFTDGNSTEVLKDDFDWAELPAIFPIIVGSNDTPLDISVEHVSTSQTNFEAAPVVVRANVRSIGKGTRTVVAQLVDGNEREIESHTRQLAADEEVAAFRFQLRPEEAGVSFYQVRALAVDRETDKPLAEKAAIEATLANNQRTLVVDRGEGTFRVLYVCGRPNWEFKFLRRALDQDPQLELIGLLRIAHREPKFTFRRRGEQSTNRLFEGFEAEDVETAERYDEPVLKRFGSADEQVLAEELRDGFPREADELYRYHAIILDDLEAEFFTQDQLSLIEDFVSRRGGGLLMLGGAESFAQGGYGRTPVGNLLPVYLNRQNEQVRMAAGREFRLSLTREGWLQPWVRLRKTEEEDQKRLTAMPAFKILNDSTNLKPGASELAQVVDESGKKRAALVAQSFGRGRSAALLIGDMWKWALRRPDKHDDDLEKSWRQTVRWLVADVPQRVEVEARPLDDAATGAMAIHVRVHDPEYLPLENANVSVRVLAPDGNSSELRAEASAEHAGSYVANVVSRVSGAFRATIEVAAPDGSAVGVRECGWVAQPLADEFVRLRPNRELLEHIATKTDGQLLQVDELNDFVASLQKRRMPVTEPWIRPLWHHPFFFVFAIGCLIGEWGLRRWKGLA